MEKTKLLTTELPSRLAELLGYRGSQRYVLIYWEQDCGLVCMDKEENCYVASDLALRLFTHKFAEFVDRYLFLLQSCLLLDRDLSYLYGGDRDTITQLLGEPVYLGMFEPITRKKWDGVRESEALRSLFKRGVVFSLGIFAFYLVIVGVTFLGKTVFSSYADSTTDCQQTLLKLVDSYPKK